MHECILSIVWCKKEIWLENTPGEGQGGSCLVEEEGERKEERRNSSVRLTLPWLISFSASLAFPHLLSSSLPFVTRLILLFLHFPVWCNWDQDSSEEVVPKIRVKIHCYRVLYLLHQKHRMTNEVSKQTWGFSMDPFLQVWTRHPWTKILWSTHPASHSCPRFSEPSLTFASLRIPSWRIWSQTFPSHLKSLILFVTLTLNIVRQQR